MIERFELSGITLELTHLSDASEEQKRLANLAAKTLRIHTKDILELTVKKRSIDARKKPRINGVYTLILALRPGLAASIHLKKGQVRFVPHQPLEMPVFHAKRSCTHRPLVVGAGCAGLFAGLALAQAGLEPHIVEQGEDARSRMHTISLHNSTGILNPYSNVQYGAGGAGTFSDGKLNTGTKSAYHRFILETFVQAGADPSILWQAQPHIGSDVLVGIVERLVNTIEDLGGTVAFNTRLTQLHTRGNKIIAAELLSTRNQTTTTIPVSAIALATGHSARDIYRMSKDLGIALERKTFAVGVRIEHLQASINKALFGIAQPNPLIGPAPYKVVDHTIPNRSVFSFCMCPGGFVVSAASEQDGVCTNGMSYSNRAGINANAGLLANVYPEDLEGSDVLAGMHLQEHLERSAFAYGGGNYAAPVQLVGDFLTHQKSTSAGGIQPTYPRPHTWGALDSVLPSYITEALRASLPHLGRKLAGFDAADAVLTGVETRSSAPVRMTRDERCASLSHPNLFVLGEGAGFAGGIMSAAADGLRGAAALIELINDRTIV